MNLSGRIHMQTRLGFVGTTLNDKSILWGAA